MKDIAYLVALHNIDGLGTVRLQKIIQHFESPKEVWGANIKDFTTLGIPSAVLEKIKIAFKNTDPEKYYDEIIRSDIHITTLLDDDYPEMLKQIYDPPMIIYYQGTLLKDEKRTIGVVGTRKVSGYGRFVTEKFTKDLVSNKFTIVSGLALGVDSIAHQSTLDAGGRTIAVLGGGVGTIYPTQNTHLAKQIIESGGCVLSEYPPSQPGTPGNFPARNRIISGLSLGVLVTEATVDSGSLITARLALEQGREVFAIPGPINSILSEGPFQLIRDGAKLTASVDDILTELGIDQLSTNSFLSTEDLSDLEKNILEVLQNEKRHIDELIRDLESDSAKISASLVKMEIQGFVRNLGGGIYIKNI